MTFEITYEPDTEKITLIYENCMAITAVRKSNGKITYSNNMNKVEEEIQPVLQDICSLLMNLE